MTRSPARLRSCLVGSVIVGSLLAAAPASASYQLVDSGSQIRLNNAFSPPQPANTVGTQSGTQIVFSDSIGALTYSPESSGASTCSQTTAASVTCTTVAPTALIAVAFGSSADKWDGSAVSGNQSVAGGLGSDSIKTGPGNDVIKADSAVPNDADALIDCGPGIDTASVDDEDANVVNCETVTGRTPPKGGGGGGGTPGSGGGATPGITALKSYLAKQLTGVTSTLRKLFGSSSATVSVKTPAAGKIKVKLATRKGKTLASGSKTAKKAGTVKVKVKKSKLGKSVLKGSSSKKVKVSVSYASKPTGTVTASKNKTLKPKKKKGKKKK